MQEIQPHIKLVKSTIAEAKKKCNANVLAAQMFDIFFESHPEARELFAPFDLKKVGIVKFCEIGAAMVDVLEYPDYSVTALNEEVFRHQCHHVKDKEYYFAIADAYVQTLKQALGEDWTQNHEDYWADTFAGLKHNINLAATEHLNKKSKVVSNG